MSAKSKQRMLCFIIAIAAAGYGDYYLGIKGALCGFLGATLLTLAAIRLLPAVPSAVWKLLTQEIRIGEIWELIRYNGSGDYPLLADTPFLLIAAFFLLAFPTSGFLQAVGLIPGVILIALLALLLRALHGELTLAVLSAIIVWCVVVWLWGEAGRQGFAVLTVDIPAGAEKADKSSQLEFTGEGMANALETEIESFGGGDYGNYAETEAAQILAGDIVSRLFPTNPWYKNPVPHAPQLKDLPTSHIISNTEVHGLPLNGIYHVLRHLRGKPLIEGQVLIGENGTLTVALRRSNYESSCFSSNISEQVTTSIKNHYTAALQHNLPGADDKLLRTIVDLIEKDRLNQPDTVECNPPWPWTILAYMDLIPASWLTQEQRIANVTVSDAKEDAQLTQALHFAAIQAMEYLNPERLAYYYDNAAKAESALKYYEVALPDLIWEYDQAHESEQPNVRLRLVEVLIRIGDLEQDPTLSEGAYALAEELAPRDSGLWARVGYHYMMVAELRHIAKMVCAEKVQEQQASNQNSDQKAGQACRDQVDRKDGLSEKDARARAQNAFAIAAMPIDGYRSFYQDYGKENGQSMLSWMNANYAYVSSQLGNEKLAEERILCALMYGDPSNQDECAEEDGRVPATVMGADLAVLFDRNQDLRPAAAAAYFWTKDGKRTQVFARASLCKKDDDPANKSLRKLDDLLKSEEPHTAYNTILIEDQLQSFYSAVSKPDISSGKGQSAQVECSLVHPTEREMHLSQMYSVATLMDYRMGNFKEAAEESSFALSAVNDEHLRRLLRLANAFIASIYEEQLSARSDETTETAAVATAAKQHLDLLLAPATENKPEIDDEVHWRALSLAVVRQVMCLNPPLTPTLCKISGNADDLKKAARQASSAMPNNAYLHANLGIVLLRLGNSKDAAKEAIAEFRDAVAISPGDPWLRCLLAFALASTGDITDVEEARAQEKFARALDPKHVEVYQKSIRSVWPAVASRQ